MKKIKNSRLLNGAKLMTALALCAGLLCANIGQLNISHDRTDSVRKTQVQAATLSSFEEAEDGIYSVKVSLKHATQDQDSMGDEAISSPAYVKIDNHKATLYLELKQLSTKFGTSTLKGYLGYMEYFADYTGTSIPKNKTASKWKEISYFKTVDSFNDASNGTDKKMKGKYYPHIISMPASQMQDIYWVQIYVPLMEGISDGSGTQYARLSVDWDSIKLLGSLSDADSYVGPKSSDTTSQTIEESSSESKSDSTTSTESKTTSTTAAKKTTTTSSKLNYKNLKDGTYAVTGKMLKTDKSSTSMANKAINHTMKLTVKNGKYYITMNFTGMNINGQKGYLGKIKYYTSGTVSGTKKSATVLSHQKGSSYPKKVKFPLAKKTISNGYAGLQVFVPVMEAISKGNGTQNVYLKLNWSSLKKSSANNKAFDNSSSGSSDSSDSSSASSSSSGSSLSSSASSASGKQTGVVYSCNITASYSHPVTGKIEDSGGSSAKATGQGMVESAIGSKGILEATTDGSYYLTVRLSLIDYTSKHSFQVQSWGDSGWSSTETYVSATGKDDNGTTNDVCIKVPSKKCVVRLSMYVNPMGRNVICYFYPGDLTEGNTTDFKPYMVGTIIKESELGTATDTGTSTDGTSDTTDTENSLQKAEGLSLSTADEKTATSSGSSSMTLGKWILAITVSIIIGGTVVVAEAAALFYYYKKNKNRLFPDARDDEEYGR